MSTSPLTPRAQPGYQSPTSVSVAALAADTIPLNEGPPDSISLHSNEKWPDPLRHPTEEQEWFLKYHFFQCVEAVKTPIARQDMDQKAVRQEGLAKLRELLRGVNGKTLLIRPGKIAGYEEPSLAEHALALLAAYGEAEDIQICLQRGIQPHAYDFNSLRTPTTLMRAVANSNLDTLQALLPHFSKAHLAQSNFYGHTALDIAFRQFFGSTSPEARQQADAVLQALQPAYGNLNYFKRYLHHKFAPTPQPDDFEEFDEESALLLS